MLSMRQMRILGIEIKSQATSITVQNSVLESKNEPADIEY